MTIQSLENGATLGVQRGKINANFTELDQRATAATQAATAAAESAAAGYDKPADGIPATDLAPAVQTSLGKADSAYAKPGPGIPATDLAPAVQTSLGKADSAMPATGAGLVAVLAGSSPAEIAQIGYSVSGYVTPWSLTIQLAGRAYMPRHQMAGPEIYTVASGSVGSSCYLELIADGVNTPVFGTASEVGGSGWDGRPGALNRVWIETLGASSVGYAVQQKVGGEIIDIVSPSLISASIPSGATNTIALMYSETLSTTLTGTPTVGGSANSIVSAAVSGQSVVLTMASSYLAVNAATITLPAGYVRDAAGNVSAAVVAQGVTNFAPTAMRLTLLSSVSETADSPATGDYTYTSTAGATYGTARAVGGRSIPASTDGAVYFYGSPGSAVMGVKSGATQPVVSTYTTYTLGVFEYAGAGKYNYVGSGLTPAAPNGTSTVKMAGDIVRIIRTSGSVKAQVARAATPSTWIDIVAVLSLGSIPVASSLQLWPVVDFGATGQSLRAYAGPEWV